MKIRTLALCIMLPLSVATALAGTVDRRVSNMSGKKLSASRIADALTDKMEQRVRSICVPDESKPKAVQCPEQKIMVPKPVSFDQITFALNSAQLTPQAREVLDMIAEALRMAKLKGRQFEVEGHTDATGGDEYNLALSKRRAESVKQYLSTVGKV